MKYIKLHPLTPVTFAAAFFLGFGEYFSKLYFLIFLHELAHLLAACIFGERSPSIRLLPYGCMLTLSDPPTGLKAAVVFSAGPLFNLAAFAFGFCPEANLLLAFFNLLPVPPLDGGMIILSLFPKASLPVSILTDILLFFAAFRFKMPLLLPIVLLFFILTGKKRRIELSVSRAARKFLGKS